jgi:hypothetical protein
MLYGYARVSTIDQDLALQRTALKAAGCEVIRAEKASGTRRNGRTELQTLLEFLREGDTLVVTRIDRLARSVKDLQDIVHELKVSKVTLKATEQPIDTGTAAGKAFPRHAGRVCRVRHQPAQGTPAPGDHRCQGARGLQGPQVVDRRGCGAAAGSGRYGWHRSGASARHRARQRVSTAAELTHPCPRRSRQRGATQQNRRPEQIHARCSGGNRNG